MELLTDIFGSGRNLTFLQMGARAFIFFFITLIFLRIAGMRTLGKKSSIDMIILIVLGSVIARGIAGVSGFGSTLVASFVLVLLHRFVSWLSYKSRIVEKLIKGERLLLYEDGTYIKNNMERAGISEHDFLEALRLNIQETDPTLISTVYLETNGQLSFIKKTGVAVK